MVLSSGESASIDSRLRGVNQLSSEVPLIGSRAIYLQRVVMEELDAKDEFALIPLLSAMQSSCSNAAWVLVTTRSFVDYATL